MKLINDKISEILSKKDNEGRVTSRESSMLEFKENFNFGNLAEYSRTMAAFANNNGGVILFGVQDSPRIPIGVQYSKFNEIKQEKITSYLLDHFTPEIDWTIGIVKDDGKHFGYLNVFANENKPIICKMNASNEIKNGEIYYRYRSQNKLIEYAELIKIIEKIKENERYNWMSLFKQVAKIGPENSAFLDMVNGRIEGQKDSLLIDEKLIPKLSFIKKGRFEEGGHPTLRLIGDVKPVSITKQKRTLKIKTSTDQNAPVMRLTDDEIKKHYPWDFKKLTSELHKRYSNFKHNQKYHRIRQKLITEGKGSFRRFLNPDNPKSSHQDFYSPDILKEFDEHYDKKK